jgi:hypothetical protein
VTTSLTKTAVRTHFGELCYLPAPHGRLLFIIATIGKNRFAQLSDMHKVPHLHHFMLKGPFFKGGRKSNNGATD